MSSTKSKTSDFTHLFELFDQLTSRRKSTTTNNDDSQPVPVPEDLEPVFRNLVTLVKARTRTQPGPKPATRARRKTVSVAPGSSTTNAFDSDSEEVPSSEAFPLDGKQYPFTFKMMLHKLYELEDWGRKVQDVLERSQNEYKPLAVQEGDAKKKGAVKGREIRPRVEFAPETNIPKKTTVARTVGRPRSHTVASMSGKMKEHVSRPGLGFAVPKSTQAIDKARSEDTRVVKKRCIGRRKSLGGKSDWFYDAAVASREVDEGRGFPTVGRTSRMNPEAEYSTGGGRPVIVRRRVISVATASPWHSPEHA
ncbi:hypothetical protein AAF712_006921 [Marasmius tenuissimus]|uniref:Uncharacterized protein n=1 Tax=Marasmius tenuissimus TaxID=585030 RepID=A0ABR2ZWN3_9AGAR